MEKVFVGPHGLNRDFSRKVTQIQIMPLKGKKQDQESKSTVNYKARLEKKLLLAQETPEPVFDLADCNLKAIPSNVFVLCKVLQKEALNLQNNVLQSLTNSSSLSELKNLKVLNVSTNKLSKLPSNINELENLEVLDVSKNELEEVPETIGGLTKLQVFNLSSNNLTSLPEGIGNCKNLQILNLTWNENLKKLPPGLGRLSSLTQLNIDSTITYPPREICRQGIYEILKFLSRGIKQETQIPSTSSEPQRKVPTFRTLEEQVDLLEKFKQEKQNERLRLEKELMDQNQKEIEMRQKLKDEKKKLLENVKNQQEKLDANLMKLQEQKIVDRALLVKLCQEEEKYSSEVVGKILKLKKNLQMQYTKEWERERKAEEEMLWNYTSQTRSLEKKNILVSMEELMMEEIQRVHKMASDKRLMIVNSVASEISEHNKALLSSLKKKEQDRTQLIETLHQDEEFQKSAVASLLERSDTISWELTRQIRIVEEQLAEITRLEVSKKKLESESHMAELNKNRIALTELLMNLLNRQTLRRNQLIETIRRMEVMRESVKDSEIFWMQQYDKLMNSKGHEMVQYLENLDSALISELYINGVFHYLPLLKEALSPGKDIAELKELTLVELGIKSTEDRSKILRAIKSFLESREHPRIVPTAPLLREPSAPPLSENSSRGSHISASYLVPDECVVCMVETPSVIFVPCGHICCCMNCFKSITSCPLCRKKIESVHTRLESTYD